MPQMLHCIRHGMEHPVCESKCAGGTDSPQLCVRIRCCMDNVPEVRQLHAAVPPGAGLEADGGHLKQGNARELDPILCRELFFSAV